MSQATRDHYEVLGVDRSAGPDEIKAAFRKLASQHHPDRNQGDPKAATRFKEVNSAYQVLGDPQRRSMYDRFGHRAEEPGSPFANGGPFAGGVVDISDIAVDGILGDLLGVFGVGKGDRGDLKHDVEITFEEAVFGCEKQVEYDRIVSCTDCRGSGSAPGTTPETCSSCNGKGRMRLQQGLIPIAVERTCTRCKGSGKVVIHPCGTCRGNGLATSRNKLSITIPQGVEPGSTRLVERAGNKPRAERPPGDLTLTINVHPHPFFRRIGDDVVCQMPISFPQAALGGEVEVPTLEGKGKLRIPPGTQPGSVLRIKGKGIPHRTALGRGDQRIEISVEIPTQLNDVQKNLIERLGQELGANGGTPQQQTFIEKLRALFG